MLRVSIRQVKAARALLDWSQEQLSRSSGISIPTIKRLEAQPGKLGGRADTFAKIVRALENGGIEFLAEDGGGVGVRLRKGRPAEIIAFEDLNASNDE